MRVPSQTLFIGGVTGMPQMIEYVKRRLARDSSDVSQCSLFWLFVSDLDPLVVSIVVLGC